MSPKNNMLTTEKNASTITLKKHSLGKKRIDRGGGGGMQLGIFHKIEHYKSTDRPIGLSKNSSGEIN